MATKKKLLTEQELLAMSEDDYMNDRQLAFFRHRLEEMEKELRSNAGQTTEHLRETAVVPDPQIEQQLKKSTLWNCVHEIVNASS